MDRVISSAAGTTGAPRQSARVIVRTVRIVRPAARRGEARGDGMVVVRKRFGTLPLDDLPPDQREGFPNGAWDTPAITALYWCEGHRTLAEVKRLTELELGPVQLDLDAYFRFLARHGYVETRKMETAPGYGRYTVRR